MSEERFGKTCEGCGFAVEFEEDDLVYDDFRRPWHRDCYTMSLQEAEQQLFGDGSELDSDWDTDF